MLRRVLVIGGRGFIGQHILARAQAAATTRALLRQPDAAFAERYPRTEIAYGDLMDECRLVWAMQDVDVVVHAASKNIDRDGTGFEEINVAGTARVCHAARIAGVEKLIYISTTGVYGHGAHRGTEESCSVAPDTDFSRSKALAEQYVLKGHAAGHFQAVVLRHRFVYGNGDVHFIPRLLRAIARSSWLPDGGRARLSVVSVEDLAEIAFQFVEHHAVGSPVYHVTDGFPVALREIVDSLCGLFGLAVPIRNAPYAVLYPLLRLYETSTRTNPEHAKRSLSSLRVKLLGRDNYFSNKKLLDALPALCFRPFSQTIRRYHAYYAGFAPSASTREASGTLANG